MRRYYYHHYYQDCHRYSATTTPIVALASLVGLVVARSTIVGIAVVACTHVPTPTLIVFTHVYN